MSLLAEIIFILGISCGLFSAGLTWIRRLILLHYKYPFTGPMYFCYWIDARALKDTVKTENSPKIRTLFKMINILIPALLISGFFLLLFSQVI